MTIPIIKKYDTSVPERFFLQHVLHFPMAAVDIVVRNEEKFALVKRNRNNLTWHGSWATPGGRIFRNERVRDAAHRILLRETGLEIAASELRLVGTHEIITPREHGITMVIAAQTEQFELKWDETSSSAKWFSKATVPASLRPEYKEILSIGGVRLE